MFSSITTVANTYDLAFIMHAGFREIPLALCSIYFNGTTHPINSNSLDPGKTSSMNPASVHTFNTEETFFLNGITWTERMFGKGV